MGIQIYASSLHAHTISKALRLGHVRNGTELEPIDANYNYDFNYQQVKMHPEPVTVLPGDSLIIDCWTDSTSRSAATIGGLSSVDEMCIAFLFYYPAVDLWGAQAG